MSLLDFFVNLVAVPQNSYFQSFKNIFVKKIIQSGPKANFDFIDNFQKSIKAFQIFLPKKSLLKNLAVEFQLFFEENICPLLRVSIFFLFFCFKIDTRKVLKWLFIEIETKILVSDKYCLEIKAVKNSNNSIQILQNKNVIETIIKFSNVSHLTCVNQFDAENNIFKLRSQGPGEVSEIFIFLFLISIIRQQYP